MSDRAATQKKFNELLEEYRRLVMMEDLGQAWIEMSEAEQLSISKISNFFVGCMPLYTLLMQLRNPFKKLIIFYLRMNRLYLINPIKVNKKLAQFDLSVLLAKDFLAVVTTKVESMDHFIYL